MEISKNIKSSIQNFLDKRFGIYSVNQVQLGEELTEKWIEREFRFANAKLCFGRNAKGNWVEFNMNEYPSINAVAEKFSMVLIYTGKIAHANLTLFKLNYSPEQETARWEEWLKQ